METLKLLKEELKKRINKDVDKDVDLNSVGIDSIDLLDFIVEIEAKFEITISDEELLNIKTLNNIVDIINSRK